MAEQESQEPTSQAAEARKTIDSLQTQLADATRALQDVKRRDDLYQHLQGKEGIKDPYGLASAMVRDVTVRDADPEQLSEVADAWIADQSKYFAASEPAPVGEPVKEPPRSPYQGPNPQAPAEPAANMQMVVGSEEWKAATRGMSMREKIEAARQPGVEFLKTIEDTHKGMFG